MSMSTHVVGFRPPDEKWKQMKAAWDSCKTAGVPVPREVARFFNDDAPDEAGVEIDLQYGKPPSAALKRWHRDGGDGFEVDLEQLRKEHPQITTIRFYNSW